MVINFLGSRTFTSPTNMTGAGKWRTSRYSLFVFTEEDRVRNYLVTRGYCYRKLAGVHNRFCDGPAKFYLT